MKSTGHAARIPVLHNPGPISESGRPGPGFAPLLQTSDGNWNRHRRLLLWKGSIVMLSWALTFLIVALIAAVLGFGFIAGTAAEIAKILFVVFLVLFIIS